MERFKSARGMIRDGAIFTLCFVAVLSLEGAVFDHLAVRDRSDKINWIASLTDRHYDLIVVGSSSAYVGVDVPTLQRHLGDEVLNLALNGTAYPEQSLVLESFLSRNSADRALIEVDVWGLTYSGYSYPYNEYKHLPYIDDPITYENLRVNFGSRAFAWRYVPFLRYAEFNTEIGWPNLVNLARGKNPPFDRYGSELSDREFNESELESTRKTGGIRYQLNPTRLAYFRRMLELCRERGIEVILYLTPEYFEIYELQKNRDALVQEYERLATRYGYPFLRFETDELCRRKELFYNTSHLNRKGALRFSERLSIRVLESLNGGA